MLINLFEAIARNCFGTKYTLHQHVLYSIWEAKHAALAEQAFTPVNNAMIHTEGGFVSACGGQSVNSVKM